MAFESYISSTELVIDDDNSHLVLPKAGEETVVVAGERVAMGLTDPPDNWLWDGGYASAMSDDELIPEEEWTERIEEMERTKTRISDLTDQAGVPIKKQTIPYCWIFCVVRSVEILRAIQNQPYVDLSPASTGSIIKGFRKQGGWVDDAIEKISEIGVVPADLWPWNAVDRSYDKPAAWEAAKLFKFPEWDALPPGSFKHLMSRVLRRKPAPIGLSWWRHAVCAVDGVVLGPRKYGIRIDNSWGKDWSDNGRGVLTQSKATPDGIVSPRTTTPSVRT